MLQVSYISFLDVWCVMCIVFIFLCLLEFAIVTSLIRGQQKAKAERIEQIGTYMIPILFITFNLIYWICLFHT